MIVRVLVSVPIPLSGEFEAGPRAIRTHTTIQTHTLPCICTYTHIHTCTHTHTNTLTQYNPDTQTHCHACTLTFNLHAHTNTNTHTCTHKHKHTHSNAHAHTNCCQKTKFEFNCTQLCVTLHARYKCSTLNSTSFKIQNQQFTLCTVLQLNLQCIDAEVEVDVENCR